MVLTYKNKFNKYYGFEKDESHSIKEISHITGYNLKGLKIIFSKGEGAFFSNPQSVRPNVNSANHWAFSRLYSAIMGGKASKIDASHLYV